jgi:hypothetical protein
MADDVLEVNGGVLQVGDKVVACSEARVQAAVRFEAGVKAAACSEARDEAGVLQGRDHGHQVVVVA